MVRDPRARFPSTSTLTSTSADFGPTSLLCTGVVFAEQRLEKTATADINFSAQASRLLDIGFNFSAQASCLLDGGLNTASTFLHRLRVCSVWEPAFLHRLRICSVSASTFLHRLRVCSVSAASWDQLFCTGYAFARCRLLRLLDFSAQATNLLGANIDFYAQATRLLGFGFRFA